MDNCCFKVQVISLSEASASNDKVKVETTRFFVRKAVCVFVVVVCDLLPKNRPQKYPFLNQSRSTHKQKLC